MEAATVTAASAAAKTASSGKSGKSGAPDFMNMIMSQLNAQKAAFTKPQAAPVQPATDKDKAASSDDLTAALDAGDLASLPADLQKMLQELAAQVQAAGKSANDDGKADTTKDDATADGKSLTLALLSPAGRQKLLAALQSLVNGLPASSRPTIETLENGILKPLDGGNLVADAGKADATTDGTTALVVSGLTPQQLTTLMKQIKDGDTTDATAAAGNALGAQIALIQLTPVVGKKDVVLAPQAASSNAGKISPQLPKADPARTVDPTDAAQGSARDAANNPLNENGSDGAAASPSSAQSSTMTPVRPGIEGLPQQASGGFDHILKMFETARQDQTAPVQSARPDPTAGGSAVAASALTASSPADGALSVTGASLDPGAIAGLQVQGLPAPTATATGLTSLVTTVPQAVYAHPATAQLAATITTQFKTDGNTSLTMRMDPPDLGHVSVKMEFRDDKTVKAVVSTDKPETYLMMQRDAHILQKALNDAGLDTGSNGLTFELSQDGSAFGQQNRQGGSQSGGKGKSGADDQQVIETTMDWSVDTGGAWHYDALA